MRRTMPSIFLRFFNKKRYNEALSELRISAMHELHLNEMMAKAIDEWFKVFPLSPIWSKAYTERNYLLQEGMEIRKYILRLERELEYVAEPAN